MADLAPVLKQKFFDASGKPLVGGKLWSYQAGTTTPKATYVDKAGIVANANPIILDANGEADVWLFGTYKFVLMTALDVVLWTVDQIATAGQVISTGIPAGGADGSVLAKMSATSGDANWKPYGFSGYSARFGQIFSSTNLEDTILKILDIQYTAPLISLSASGGTTVREKGASVTSTTLTATTTKRSNPIGALRFYQGATLINTSTGGGIPNGGVNTYAYATPFTDNITFTSQVDDTLVAGAGPTTVTASTSFTFVYPYYSDAGASGKTAAQVGALSKTIITSSATVVKTMTATAGQVLYFAYPAAYGALISILDVNNFETILDWTLTTSNITGLDASAQSYRIYEFKNPLIAGSYQYTFKR